MIASIVIIFSKNHHCSAMIASMTKQNKNYFISYKRKCTYTSGKKRKIKTALKNVNLNFL